MTDGIDHSALMKKLEQLERDIRLLKMGTALLLERLPGNAIIDEGYREAERQAYWRRRPGDVDALSWAVQRTLDSTDQAVRDIERIKLKLDDVLRHGFRI